MGSFFFSGLTGGPAGVGDTGADDFSADLLLGSVAAGEVTKIFSRLAAGPAGVGEAGADAFSGDLACVSHRRTLTLANPGVSSAALPGVTWGALVAASASAACALLAAAPADGAGPEGAFEADGDEVLVSRTLLSSKTLPLRRLVATSSESGVDPDPRT